MGKLWLNNELVDRLAMLQQTEATHPGVNQVAIEKDWWVTVTLKALFQTDCREWLIFKGDSMESWKANYADMRRFFIYGQSLEFDKLMQKISELQKRVRDMAI